MKILTSSSLALNHVKVVLNVSMERAASIVLATLFLAFGILIMLTQSWYGCAFYISILSLLGFPLFKCISVMLRTEQQPECERAMSAPAVLEKKPADSFEELSTEFHDVPDSSTPVVRRRRAISLRELIHA